MAFLGKAPPPKFFGLGEPHPFHARAFVDHGSINVIDKRLSRAPMGHNRLSWQAGGV